MNEGSNSLKVVKIKAESMPDGLLIRGSTSCHPGQPQMVDQEEVWGKGSCVFHWTLRHQLDLLHMKAYWRQGCKGRPGSVLGDSALQYWRHWVETPSAVRLSL